MTLKLNILATAATFAFATAAAAQTQPTTTQTTTTQTKPTTSQSEPATTQTTTKQTPPTTSESQPATTQTTTTQTPPTTCKCPPETTTQTTTQTEQTTSEPGATDQPAATPTGQMTKATAADIKAGASVYDQTGTLVGKVDSVDANGALVNTGKARAQIPLSSFGKNDKGLVVSATKADLDAKARETKPKS